MEKKLYEQLLAAQKDPDSMVALLHQFHPLVQKYARMLAYEDARSDLLVKLIEKIKKWDLDEMRSNNDYTLLKYFERMVQTAAYNLLSQRSRLPRYTTIPFSAFEPEYLPLEAVEDDYTFILQDLFDQLLTARQSEIMQLLFLNQYSVKQVAELLGIREETVYVTKKRALQRLRTHYLSQLR